MLSIIFSGLISPVLWAFAAMWSALGDTLDDHYSESIFYSPTDNFWNKDGTWNQKKFLGNAVPNAWHIAKLFMLFCFFSVGYFHNNFLHIFHSWFWNWCFEGVIYGLVWGITFEYFYNHAFIKKK